MLLPSGPAVVATAVPSRGERPLPCWVMSRCMRRFDELDEPEGLRTSIDPTPPLGQAASAIVLIPANAERRDQRYLVHDEPYVDTPGGRDKFGSTDVAPHPMRR